MAKKPKTDVVDTNALRKKAKAYMAGVGTPGRVISAAYGLLSIDAKEARYLAKAQNCPKGRYVTRMQFAVLRVTRRGSVYVVADTGVLRRDRPPEAWHECCRTKALLLCDEAGKSCEVTHEHLEGLRPIPSCIVFPH